MKKLYTVLLLALFSIGANAQQQIPNSGFETWVDPFGMGQEDPANYITFDFFEDNVTKSTDAHSGSFSARLTTTYLGVDTILVQDSVGNVIDTVYNDNSTRGFMMLGELNMMTFEAVTGMAFSGLPTHFRFWAKGIVAPGDTAGVIVALTKYNPAIGEGEPVAIAWGMMISSVANWTLFEVPFEYLSTQTPDTLLVIASSTFNEYATGDAQIFLDDFELVYGPTAVAEINNAHIAVFPNPSAGRVSLAGAVAGCDIRVTDVTGRVVLRTEALSENVQLDLPATGVFVITATAPDGNVVLRKKVTVQ